jgi:ketosteroid isomerase-like protein
MNELDEFLSTTLERLIQAERALLHGDPAPWLAMWSTHEPVTLFGVNSNTRGAAAVPRTFQWQVSWFTNCTAHSLELVAAGVSGDLAYTVALEHASVSVGGGPVQSLTTRATHVYRREDAEWKIVHRHSDQPPIEQGLPAGRRPARRQGRP